jgi:hypothetical protein
MQRCYQSWLERVTAEIRSVQSDTSWDLLVGCVEVEDAVLCIADPYNFRGVAPKRRFGDVSRLGINKVPRSAGLFRRPVEFRLGE